MTTVAEIKSSVGYRSSWGPCCGNCVHLGRPIGNNVNGQCGENNFATGRGAWCEKHQWRKEAKCQK